MNDVARQFAEQPAHSVRGSARFSATARGSCLYVATDKETIGEIKDKVPPLVAKTGVSRERLIYRRGPAGYLETHKQIGVRLQEPPYKRNRALTSIVPAQVNPDDGGARIGSAAARESV